MHSAVAPPLRRNTPRVLRAGGPQPLKTTPNWIIPNSIIANMEKTSANSTRTEPSSLLDGREAVIRNLRWAPPLVPGH